MRECEIRINPFEFVDIQSINIYQKVNEHARAKVYGLLDSDYIDTCHETLLADTSWVKIEVLGEEKVRRNLFCGVIKAYELYCKDSLYYLELDLISGTYLMDQKPHIRVFQEKQKTYEDMYKKITGEYYQNGIVFGQRAERTVEKLMVQYKETDWEFANRLAACSGEFLVPEVLTIGTRYFTKFPKRETVTLSESTGYEMYKKHLVRGITEMAAAIQYKSREIHSMGDKVLFKGQSFCIFQIESFYLRGELWHKYHLASEKESFSNKMFAERIAGVSMLGNVKKVKEDKVYIDLVEDEYRTSSYRWFPYSTVYSSPDGTGWYCMPEVGDQIRLHFPNANESEAYVISAVHLPTECGRTNPDEKSFKNKYNKEILFTPEKLLITNNAGSFIELSDEDGVRIQSDKSIHIHAKDQVVVTSEEQDVTLSAAEVLRLNQKETSIKLDEDIILSGGEFRIQ